MRGGVSARKKGQATRKHGAARRPGSRVKPRQFYRRADPLDEK